MKAAVSKTAPNRIFFGHFSVSLARNILYSTCGTKFYRWTKKPILSDEAGIPADFETALAATGFGKFNFLLFLIAFPTCWAPMFQTTTMSYVFPAAQCDLNLTLEDKGLLNGVTFAGKEH